MSIPVARGLRRQLGAETSPFQCGPVKPVALLATEGRAWKRKITPNSCHPTIAFGYEQVSNPEMRHFL